MSLYPALRLRRTRSTAWSRALVSETHLAPAHLIWPLFVTEGQGVDDPIARARRARA
jgi:porphobilinogen synthase